MDGTIWRLTTALAAFAAYRTPSKMRSALQSGPVDLMTAFASLPEREQDLIAESAAELEARGVDAHLLGTASYPASLRSISSAPPVLFSLGNRDLFGASSVGMCGSRHTSEQGLRAAMACGVEVASHGLTIVSGYARGVDTQTHLAALEGGGSTIIVLAEGINRFRKKRDFAHTGLPMDRVLVVSQFEPGRPWSVGGAMSRNGVIAGLSKALVVIEAGETGGTLDAGRRAIGLKRPVITLQFESMVTPPGNQLLIDEGAVPVHGRKEMARTLDAIDESLTSSEPLQLRFARSGPCRPDPVTSALASSDLAFRWTKSPHRVAAAADDFIDLDDARRGIAKWANLTEVDHVTYFAGYRTHPTDGSILVTVAIHDAGAEAGNLRWSVTAADEAGPEIYWNPDSTVEGAIRDAHWHELDAPIGD